MNADYNVPASWQGLHQNIILDHSTSKKNVDGRSLLRNFNFEHFWLFVCNNVSVFEGTVAYIDNQKNLLIVIDRERMSIQLLKLNFI